MISNNIYTILATTVVIGATTYLLLQQRNSNQYKQDICKLEQTNNINYELQFSNINTSDVLDDVESITSDTIESITSDIAIIDLNNSMSFSLISNIQLNLLDSDDNTQFNLNHSVTDLNDYIPENMNTSM
jgi:hypothetical protein